MSNKGDDHQMESFIKFNTISNLEFELGCVKEQRKMGQNKGGQKIKESGGAKCGQMKDTSVKASEREDVSIN